MWDAIVIGSGIGGLAAAAALSKRKVGVTVPDSRTDIGPRRVLFVSSVKA
jgi:phytoene dehydrogenase-like protein